MAKKDEETDTPSPRTAPPKQSAIRLKIRITKFGDGLVSTGAHVVGEGDIFASAGDVLESDPVTASQLEKRGFAEIV